MQVDVGDLLHSYGLKLFIAIASLVGTTVGGAYYSLDSRIKQNDSNTQVTNQSIARIEAKVDTVIELVKARK